MLLFFKLVDETQISTPPEATRHHNSTKLYSKIPLHTHADNSTTKKEVTSCALDNFQDLHFRFHIKSYGSETSEILNLTEPR